MIYNTSPVDIASMRSDAMMLIDSDIDMAVRWAMEASKRAENPDVQTLFGMCVIALETCKWIPSICDETERLRDPENRVLGIDELRKKVSDPVWVESKWDNYPSGWGIVSKRLDGEIEIPTLKTVYRESLHGKQWAALLRKP